MIKVKVTILPENKYDSIEIKGHAGYAPKGQDLVCAGVSSVVTGAINNLKDYDSFKIVHEEGNVLIKRLPEKEISKHDEVVIETMLTQLKTIEYSYSKFIKIINYL